MQLNENLNKHDVMDLFNYSSDLVAILDRDGTVSYFNNSWNSSLGYELEQSEAMRLWDVLDVKETDHAELMQSVEEGSGIRSFSGSLTVKDGDLLDVDGTVRKIENLHDRCFLMILKISREHNMQKEKQLLKIIELGKKLSENDSLVLDHQMITDGMRELTDGKYVCFNVFDEHEKSHTSIALSGNVEDIVKAESILHSVLENRKWAMDPIKAIRTEGQSITVFDSLRSLGGPIISTQLLSMVEEEFHTGEVIVVRIDNKQKYLGDFTIIMPKGLTFNAHEAAEIYASQTGLFMDKNRVLKELKDHNDKFDFAMETAGVATWAWDLLKDELNPSSRWYSMMGYNKDEFNNDIHSWEMILHPDEAAKNMEALEEYLNGFSEPFELIHRVKHKDGHYIWVMTRGFSLRDSQGKPYLFSGFHVDISSSREEENRSTIEREKFSNIIEGTNAGTWEWNVQSGVTEYNERWAEIVGYTLEELSPVTEETWIKLVHPDDLIRSNEEIESLFYRKKEFYSLACRMKHKKGHWVWVLDKGKVTSWTEDGKPLHMFGTHIDITESKLREMEIKESEDNYRFLVESSYDIVYRIALDGTFIFLSKAWENILGHSVKEVIGKSFKPYLHPDDLPKIYDFFKKINDSGERGEATDYRIIHKDGTYRWFTTNAIPILSEDNKVIGFAGAARDITEVKAANLALVEQKNELEHFFNVNLDFFCIADKHGNFKKINYAWEKNLGYEPELLVEKNALDYVHPEDVELLKSSIRHMNAKQKEVIFIIRFRRADGGYRTLEWKAQTSDNLIYAAARDVTENKNLENNLFIEKELFKTTLLSVGDAVISTDSLGRISIMNKVAEAMTGWTVAVAIGRPIEDVFKVYHSKTGRPLQNRVREILRKKKSAGVDEMILISNNGKETLIEDSAAPIRDSSGNINGVVIVFRDITAKKEREKRIEFMSYHDSLTGLYNRRYVEDAIKRMDTTRNQPFTVMVMDVNGLKITNDAFGHQLGDLLLKRTASIIKSVCRENDVLSRVGGDEFVLLLPKTESLEAEKIKNRIIQETEKVYIGPVSISIAIGHATKEQVTQNILEVQKVADNNMYRDKLKNGKVTKSRIVKTILSLIDEKFPNEREHLRNVAEYSAEIARYMGFTDGDIERVRLAGKLHDIGKISVPKEILLKPLRLTFEEYEIIKKHAETSYQILKSVEEYAGIAEDVLYHHERIDGKGYPEGLKGSDIPLNSRIIAVADAYEAMTGARMYQNRKSKEEAIQELKRCSGTQFDPSVVQVFADEVLRDKKY